MVNINISSYRRLHCRICSRISASSSVKSEKDQKELMETTSYLIYKYIGCLQSLFAMDKAHKLNLVSINENDYPVKNIVHERHVFFLESYIGDAFLYFAKSCLDAIPRILAIHYPTIFKSKRRTFTAHSDKDMKKFVTELNNFRRINKNLADILINCYATWIRFIVNHRDYSAHNGLWISASLPVLFKPKNKIDYRLCLPSIEIKKNRYGQKYFLRNQFNYKGRNGQNKKGDYNTLAAFYFFTHFSLILTYIVTSLFYELYQIQIKNKLLLQKLENLKQREELLSRRFSKPPAHWHIEGYEEPKEYEAKFRIPEIFKQTESIRQIKNMILPDET